MKSEDIPQTEKSGAAEAAPCLIETRQGFSVLYKNHYLYSRIQPASSIEKIIKALMVRSETLILCFSPVLGYGLELLLSVIPADCRVLAVERDEALFTLSQKSILPAVAGNHAFSSIHVHTAAEVLLRVRDIGVERFRRCVVVEMSAGVSLNSEFYQSIVPLVDEMIGQFWKNRITLIKMGRLYAKNLFINLGRVSRTQPLVPGSIHKPIMVCGAGPSLDETIDAVQFRADAFFILAVDSALIPLLRRGILPDAVIAVESQIANEKAFIGTAGTRIPLYLDLTSRPQLIGAMGGPAVFFFSEFADTGFVRHLRQEGVLPFTIPPLGSVGLAAMYLALALRTQSAPIFFTGLDFSFIPGKTHCRETPSIRAALNTSNRLRPVGDPAAAYTEGSFSITGKNGRRYISQPALSFYGQLFCARFSGQEGIFDAGPSGMNTGCPQCSPAKIRSIAENWTKNTSPVLKEEEPAGLPAASGTIRRILTEEKEALTQLRAMLSEGTGAPEKILSLLHNREYLYLHFPDGHLPPSVSISFLKRVRSEIDFFLKYIDTALLLSHS